MDERPTDVTPTEVKTRKTRSDAGKPRTPEERAARLSAKAEVILADARAAAQARIRAKAEKLCERAFDALGEAAALMASVDAGKAGSLRSIAEMVDGLELGAS